MLKIKTLENTTIEKITDTFNQAFSDYSTPIVFKKEQFEVKFASEGGRLDLSVGAFENEKLVAFILHFVDMKEGEKYVYNGGTGVIPAFRGNRLTSKMYDFILPKLNNDGVDKMILEVFTDNHSALKIYQNRGFKIYRELNCFKGKLDATTPDKLPEEYKVVELKDLNWKKLQSFWDYQPTWQNSVSTMNNLIKQNINIGVQKDDTLLGYLIYDPNNKRIHQMAVDEKHRDEGIGSHLLNYISKIEHENLSFINIDTRNPNFKSFLEKRGLKNYVNQYEMELELKNEL